MVLAANESCWDSHGFMIVPWPKQVADLLPGFNNWVPREHGVEAIDTVEAAGDIEDAPLTAAALRLSLGDESSPPSTSLQTSGEPAE